MSRPYALTQAASVDLREIARYTLKQWGPAQTRAYNERLKNAMVALATGEASPKN